MATFDPTKYGLTLEMSPANILAGMEAHKQLVQGVKASSETAASQESELRKNILAETANDEDLFHAVDRIRTLVWAVINDRPELSVGLFEKLQEVKSDLRTFRDVFIAEDVRDSRPTTVNIPSDFVERKAEAETLGNFVKSLFKAMQPMAEAGLVDLSEIPTRTLDKSGEVVPNLDRLPNGPREAGTGRKSATYMLRFYVDNEELPQGTTLQAAAIKASSASHIFSAAWITAEVKRLFGEKYNLSEGFTLDLPNGVQLVAINPTGEVVEESDDEESDDDDNE